MIENLLGAWYPLLKEELEQEYFKEIRRKLSLEYKTYDCHPPAPALFRAYGECPPETVKVIIIGQDPYPSVYADGLAFSTSQKGTPYSLQKILREVDRDVVKTITFGEFKVAFPSNSLLAWAKQGVLLLNPVLSVRDGEPKSHRHLGWERFTSRSLELLLEGFPSPKVIMAWGGDAKGVVQHLASAVAVENKHLVLEAGHPASGSHGKDTFSGCNHFSKANRYLSLNNVQSINWKL